MQQPLDKRPAGLIFDLDGTLLDTEPLYGIATQKVLDPYNVEFTMELKRRVMGGDALRSAQIVIDAYHLPLTAKAYLIEREVYLLELFSDVTEIPCAGEFISQLAGSNIPLGLATSSHQRLSELKLSAKPWGQLFHQVVCGDDPELGQGKPNPDIFLLCARKLSVDPKQCIAFEDSPNGISAARAAHMRVIAINSPYVDQQDLSKANLVIDSYHELDSLLRGWLKQID